MNIQPLGHYIKTTTDAKELSQLLDLVSDGLFKTDESVLQAVLRQIPYELGNAINKLALEEGIGMDNKAGVQEFFVKLQDAIQRIPVVKITVAIQPKNSLVTQIHEWFYRTYNRIVLLDITVSPDIIAGSIISAGGKYYDASLKRKSEGFWVAQKTPMAN